MIIIKNELNICEVETLHQELLEEFSNETVLIDMKNVTKIDMSIIQLLISIQKSCLEISKKFELQNITSNVEKILKNCACDFLLRTSNG